MQIHSRLDPIDPMMQTTIGLSRFSGSLALRMQCAYRQSRGLYLSCNVGLKVGKKRWTNVLGFAELIAKKTMEQPTMNQIIMKNINTLNPYNKVLPITERNELNVPFICCFFLSFFSLFVLIFIFFLLFLVSFFFFFFQMEIKTSKGIIS